MARVVLGFAMGIVSTAAVFLTRCLGGLPVVHQTLLAPLYFFDRSFTLHVLASIGGEYAGMVAEP